MTTLALGPEWLSPEHLISTFSLPGILLIVFAESGLFAFLPGDSLLFTAGLFVAEGTYISQPLWLVCTLIVLAAVLGDQVGYMIGKFLGPKLFSRPNSKLFKQENLDKAHEFMEKYGPKAIVLARFVPIVRTFAPIVAGAGRMKYRTFLTYNVVGGIAWGTGVTVAGYWLGQIDFINKNVEAILVLIVLLSVVPIIIEYLRERAKNKRAAAQAPEEGRHQQPQQPPAMDDATTQLRRITPDDRPPHGHPQQQSPYGDGNGRQGRQGHPGRQDQQYHGQYPQSPEPGYGAQQPYGRQQAPQQPYGSRQGGGGQDPYGNGY
ncbi:VTT domain-containing protein [Streptomyces sp. NPDC059720]|uniref:DedA family protein n=1 Tax=Streptomyces sp. NPDC059720 TaxID=3346924 RepID=UPI0036A997E3